MNECTENGIYDERKQNWMKMHNVKNENKDRHTQKG